MKTILKAFIIPCFVVLLAISCNKKSSLWDWMIPETEDTSTAAQINGYIFRPALAPASAENIQQLKVPEGFSLSVFAREIGKPRILATHNENVYVSDREAGKVLLLKDTDGDGESDLNNTVAEIKQAHGLAVHNSRLYIVAVKELYVADINADGSLGTPQMLTDKLPDGGQHPNRTIGIGPDNKLYISIGSTCNSCDEPNDLNGTMAIANLDASGLRIFSKGLRNTIGFAWHPSTGQLWGMDHGIDWLGDDDQKEELNHIRDGANYGWPYIYGEGKFNPGDRPPGDTTYSQYLAITSLPTLTYQAHAAPMQLAFYNGDQYPQEYHQNAFIAMRGSWNRSTPVGYKVVRIVFENNQPVRFEDFLSGFLVNNNKSHFGRLVGIAVHQDGSLLVSDDTNGMIYRISHD